MGERHTIEVKNSSLGNNIAQAAGIEQVREALHKHGRNLDNQVGFTLAIAITEGLAAEMRAKIAGDALREAHRAGIDIGQSKEIYASLLGRYPFIEIEMRSSLDDVEQRPKIPERIDA